MQTGKRLTLKYYFSKRTRTHKNHKNTNVDLLFELSSSVIFRQYGVSQSECKIDRPRPGLSRLSPRPHTKALRTRLPWILIGRITCHIWPRLARVNWSRYLSHSAHACPSEVIYFAC
jgi:hypothetical protein